jgi:hypothetical protein
MPTSELTGEELSATSEAWRRECELRYLLEAFPRRADKHLHLYGVEDREQLFRFDSKTGQMVLRDQYDFSKSANRNAAPASVFKFRGLAAADQLLADAKQLHDLRRARAAQAA